MKRVSKYGRGIYKRGEIFWIKYYRNGKPYRESTKSDKITVAQRFLKKREGEISEGKLPGIYFDKVKFNELAADYLTDYKVNERDSLDKAKRSVQFLGKKFNGMRATDLTTAKINEYINYRMEKGLSNASINRELGALKRMFNLGARCTPPKVALIPHFSMLKESNARKGFFEADEYGALKNAMPEELKPIIIFAYHSGWRKSEILGLTWDKVDLKEGIVRLDPEETKNEEGRTLYLNDELMEEIQVLHGKRRLGCAYVFHRNGQPIRYFRRSWKSACIKVGLFELQRDGEGNVITDKKENPIKVPTKIFHDFRRTAIRNMVRAGIPERVAMMVSGHKTRTVFERYNIVSDVDLKEAARKQQAYYERQKGEAERVEVRKGDVIAFKEAQSQ
jgi:integrase